MHLEDIFEIAGDKKIEELTNASLSIDSKKDLTNADKLKSFLANLSGIVDKIYQLAIL